ncbi:MAG: magnesium chelatase, partial [Bacteroidetes bacterium]|nr:magnesium chelatase [Bacteroidota bacterium]
VGSAELIHTVTPENSTLVATIAKIKRAREIQMQRWNKIAAYSFNAQASGQLIRTVSKVETEGLKILEKAAIKFGYSARVVDRLFKVARTIADLEEQTAILPGHFAEAIQFRNNS